MTSQISSQVGGPYLVWESLCWTTEWFWVTWTVEAIPRRAAIVSVLNILCLVLLFIFYKIYEFAAYKANELIKFDQLLDKIF